MPAFNAKSAIIELAGVRLTSPDRIVFPQQGISKRDLAAYYLAVAGRMLPYVAKRPLSLVRCPGGLEDECFFQKHFTTGFPSAMGKVNITEKSGEEALYLSVENAGSLVAAIQMGAVEFHVWGARNDNLEKPDRLVIDLDPDSSICFRNVREAAFEMRDKLDALGLQSFPLLTGGKGIHVVIPLQRRHSWQMVSSFARDFARHFAEGQPDRFVSTAAKDDRKSRIFIDWLRNERGATAIAPYSVRARNGAPVATPVSWTELSHINASGMFHIETIAERLKGDDPWSDYHMLRQNITGDMISALS